MKNYPFCNSQDLMLTVLQRIIQLRNQEDVNDWSNLNNVFVSGRSTKRIPSASTDVIAADKVGDITNDDDYLYMLITTTTDPLWARIPLDISW